MRRRPVSEQLTGADRNMPGKPSQNNPNGSAFSSAHCSAKERLHSLSKKAKSWLHTACDQMNDVGEYIDDPECRAECVAKGVIQQLRGKRIEVSAEINDLVYSQGYLVNTPNPDLTLANNPEMHRQDSSLTHRRDSRVNFPNQ